MVVTRTMKTIFIWLVLIGTVMGGMVWFSFLATLPLFIHDLLFADAATKKDDIDLLLHLLPFLVIGPICWMCIIKGDLT